MIEALTHPTMLIFYGVYLFFALFEALRPGRALPRVGGWRLKGYLFFAGYVLVTLAMPMLWDEALAEHQLIDGASLGVAGGFVVGLLALQLVSYGWHRLLHAVPALWRIHQTHHSAERLDMAGAFYFHPLGMVGWAAVGSFALVLVIGLEPLAVAAAALTTAFAAMLGHANVRTPRWLGYIVNRPEAHQLHHARGVHRYNYADIPLIDMVFGTFVNPTRAESDSRAQGFYPGASGRLPELLALRDVTTPPRPGATLSGGERGTGALAARG